LTQIGIQKWTYKLRIELIELVKEMKFEF